MTRLTLSTPTVPMFSTKPKFKLQFFDRSIIKKRWKRINKDPLAKAGVIVMKTARGSIRRGENQKTNRPSKPGKPPKSRVSGKLPPFKMIFSRPNKLGTSVIVGMVGFGGTSGPPTPGLHEHGGAASRTTRPRTKSGWINKHVKPVKRVVRYPPRPFMQPALEKKKQQLPHLWKGSVTR